MKDIKYIPFAHSDNKLRSQYVKAFEDFLDNKQYILGKNVTMFEQNWATYCQTKYAVGVGNGYDALFIAVKALGIQKGDEIILPAHTFAATALAVLNAGAVPVLIDADPSTFNIDVSKIEEQITKKTKAIMVVHLYGNPCEMDDILSICKNYKLFLIEDNAQAQGAFYKGKITGSFGDITATSFYPIKNIGALGDAGAVNTSSEELFEKVKLLRSYGSPDKHEMKLEGVNSRLDELQAAFLNIKLNYLDEWNNERKNIANIYYERLKQLVELQLCRQPDYTISANHIFPVLTERKEELRSFLLNNGIQTLRHYPLPFHLENAFRELKHKKGDFPITEDICNGELSLPIFPGLSEIDVNYICDTIIRFFKH